VRVLSPRLGGVAVRSPPYRRAVAPSRLAATTPGEARAPNTGSQSPAARFQPWRPLRGLAARRAACRVSASARMRAARGWSPPCWSRKLFWGAPDGDWPAWAITRSGRCFAASRRYRVLRQSSQTMANARGLWPGLRAGRKCPALARRCCASAAGQFSRQQQVVPGPREQALTCAEHRRAASLRLGSHVRWRGAVFHSRQQSARLVRLRAIRG